jgi:hypothetical protein
LQKISKTRVEQTIKIKIKIVMRIIIGGVLNRIILNLIEAKAKENNQKIKMSDTANQNQNQKLKKKMLMVILGKQVL